MTKGNEIREEFELQIRREVDIPGVVAVWKKLSINSAIDPGPGQFVNGIIKRAYGEGLWVVSLDDQKPQKEDNLQKIAGAIATLSNPHPDI